MLLEIEDVTLLYGRIQALHGISLTVDQGEIVALIGANGAGKSTTMRAISGLRPMAPGLRSGSTGRTSPSCAPTCGWCAGVCQSPEGRGIFPGMTVRENLEMGAYTRRDRAAIAEDLERVFGLFPRLQERRKQAGGTLSGGEQQMLAVGRALMSRPKLLLLDEPSMGLAPMLIQQIFEIITEINQQGTTVLLVEQNAQQALSPGAPGVRAGDRPDRQGRHRPGAAARPRGQGRVPGRRLALAETRDGCSPRPSRSGNCHTRRLESLT